MQDHPDKTPSFSLRRANVKDVDPIFRLTSEIAKRQLMLFRSKNKIINMLANFVVAESPSGEILGCGAFTLLWTDLGEICALAVDPKYQGKGIGKAIVVFLIDEGRRFKVPEIMTLTYQVEFFKKLGFTVTDKDRFPRKIWRECLECPKLEECDETAMYLVP